MEQLSQEFSLTLFELLRYLHTIFPTEDTEKLIDIYQKLDMNKIVIRINTILSKHKDTIEKDELEPTMFVKPIFILPNIDLSKYYPRLNKDKKNRILLILKMLLLQSDMILSLQRKKNLFHKSEKINLSVGKLFDGQEYDKDIDPKDLASMSKVLGLDKMIDMKGLSEQLQTMTPEDIDKATDNIMGILGNDTGSKKMIGDMLGMISGELKATDLKEKNPMELITGIAKKVAKRMNPKLKSGEMNPDDLMKSMESLSGNIGNSDIFKQVMGAINNPDEMDKIAEGMKQMGLNGNPAEILKQMKKMGLSDEMINSNFLNLDGHKKTFTRGAKQPLSRRSDSNDETRGAKQPLSRRSDSNDETRGAKQPLSRRSDSNDETRKK